jgi:cystathionine beta-lyase/cystathionine gamma-synthase
MKMGEEGPDEREADDTGQREPADETRTPTRTHGCAALTSLAQPSGPRGLESLGRRLSWADSTCRPEFQEKMSDSARREQRPPSPATLLVHADRHLSDDCSLAPPILPSATHAARDAADFAEMASRPRHPRFYTRYGNPTHERAAHLIARLEGAETALMTASGMGAISTTALGLLRAGDLAVGQTSHYMGTTKLFTDVLPRFGVRTKLVDQRDTAGLIRAVCEGARLVMVETPVNPTMTLTDLREVAEAARSVGAISVADNTFASPINQRPLEAGIDLVVHSATKYLGGHHDLIAGVVAGREKTIEQIWETAIVLGATLGAFDAWLLLRGLRTLPLRVARANENAMTVAGFLESHPAVEAVHYPGLESHPQHALARRQMSGFGGVLAVRIRGGYQPAARFVAGLRLFTNAVSLGGVESLAVHAAAMWAGTLDEAQMLQAGVEPNLVRLACGIEDAQDLVDDLAQALEQAA